MSRGKLTIAVTVKLDDADVKSLDRRMRKRERETGVPLSRALVLRELVRERLEAEDAEATDAEPARARA